MRTDESRRAFLKAGVLLGAGALIGRRNSSLLARTSEVLVPEAPDVSVVHGDDYYAMTVKAVKMLGGMQRFVARSSSVGLLVNSRYNKPGTYVKPEIVIAVLDMCAAAGAGKVTSLENVSDSYWRLNSFARDHSEVIRAIDYAGNNYKKVAIPHGVSLKEAELQSALLECDSVINIPIFKQHEGIRMTGCLKNLMGLTSRNTNGYFHNGSGKSGWYSDVPFLAQCIADVNLVRKSDLCIADATEFITSNGPFGPGNVVKAKKLVAGTDIVAVDAVGAEILGHVPADILPIRMAHKHGLGEIDLKKVNIRES